MVSAAEVRMVQVSPGAAEAAGAPTTLRDSTKDVTTAIRVRRPWRGSIAEVSFITRKGNSLMLVPFLDGCAVFHGTPTPTKPNPPLVLIPSEIRPTKLPDNEHYVKYVSGIPVVHATVLAKLSLSRSRLLHESGKQWKLN